MKKALLLLGLIILIPGCTTLGPMPLLKEGVYPLKVKTFTYLELASKSVKITANVAELTETKPDELTVDLDYEKFTDVRFGSFRFGNNGQKTWFLIGKDTSGYWSYFYLDQGLDHHLTKQDKIILQNADGHVKGLKISTTFTQYPISIIVSYKGETRIFTQKLYFFIDIDDYSKNGLHDVLAKAFDATFFEGAMPILVGQAWRLFNFRLIDTDSNGCFNDYGRDSICIDENNDGTFQKIATHKLVEYFDSTSPDKQQMQAIVPPYPAKIGITKVNQAFDLTTLEPEVDQNTQAKSPQDSESDKSVN